jgi:hypothetical protein
MKGNLALIEFLPIYYPAVTLTHILPGVEPKRTSKMVPMREWAGGAAQAEAHGLAPLLYLHLKGTEVQLPLATKRELQGLYLRHRHANQVRTRVLHEVLAAYQSAGIPALVLKGAALFYLVYPEPGLRPMSDMDILVPESELMQCLVNARNLPEHGFPEVARLVKRVPAYKMSYAHFDQLGECIESMLQSALG